MYLRVRDAVVDNLVVECTERSNCPLQFDCPVRFEVPSKKFFTESTAAYRRSHSKRVTTLVFHGASSKIETVAVICLLAFDAVVGEFSSFIGAQEVHSRQCFLRR